MSDRRKSNICSSVVPVWTVEIGGTDTRHCFDLAPVRGRKVDLNSPDGTAHLLVADSDRAIQVIWLGADMENDRLVL